MRVTEERSHLVADLVNHHGGHAVIRTPMTDRRWWSSVAAHFRPPLSWVIPAP